MNAARAALALGGALLASSAHAQQAPLELEQRVESLEQELARLASERGRSGYDGGFYVESADGALRLTLGGLLQVNAWVYPADLPGRDDRVELRRFRLEIGGQLGDPWRFNIEPQFVFDEFEMAEAWIGAELGGGASLAQVGKAKEPFGLEELSPRKHIDFVEYSLLNQFSPAEDIGVIVRGAGPGENFSYGLGGTSGTSDDVLVDDEDLAGRLVWKPFAGDESSALSGLQFGAAATWGRADDENVSGEELVLETRDPFLSFEPGSSFDGERTRLGLEAAWLSGPFALTAEAQRIEQESSGPGRAVESEFDGWYVAASWVLTGEDKTFRGVHPARPFLRGGGPGAWQLAARFSELALDSDMVSAGLIAPTSFPGEVSSLDLGVNWYLTYEVRLKLHWVRSSYADSIVIDGDSRDSEDALILQAQMNF